MIELSISIEGLFGLTWPQWKRLVRSVEDLGFRGLYLSDHFVQLAPPDYPSLEMVVALTYLADHTDRVRFGPMVAPLSIREPVMLARQMSALDDLSGGRAVLGVGAGWMEREHIMFGYDLGDLSMRFARFEEGLEIITRLCRASEPVDFEGQYFSLKHATLPEPKRSGGPEIMIGGIGPSRTLPLVARFADAWNAQYLVPEHWKARSDELDRQLGTAGRNADSVRRTVSIPVVCWRTNAELQSRLQTAHRFPAWQGLSAAEIIGQLKSGAALIGTPEEVANQIRAYETIGVSEIIMQWLAADDIEGLEMLAHEVLPQFG
jgi:alkanesulfonate monooxygenase SsuD/methylene tetrahydromethanopterin reductase-like flavin-dependent oxidoreductase (luciferase family)